MVNTAVLRDPPWVGSAGVEEPRVWTAYCKLYVIFNCAKSRRSNPCLDQG